MAHAQTGKEAWRGRREIFPRRDWLAREGRAVSPSEPEGAASGGARTEAGEANTGGGGGDRLSGVTPFRRVTPTSVPLPQRDPSVTPLSSGCPGVIPPS